LLQKAGLVDDKNRILVGERFQSVIAHDIAQCICVPPAAAQDRLLTPWARIAGRLRAHPTRLARFVPQKPVQKLPRRCRYSLLTKQRTYPRLNIPQRRYPKLKRRLDRCSRHP
jgi:hypothetical protein